MGQAFRRATGRIPASSSSSSKTKTAVDRRPPVVPTEEPKISRTAAFDGGDQADGNRQVNADNVLETRDPKYDAMLNQMMGRITTKPGGKLEMGEAFVVERYNRPMPKLRNTKLDSGGYEERPVPPGTLNVAQLRHIMLLHQGKADDHDGPMDVNQIAKKFRVDVMQVQAILQSLSLPPEDNSKRRNTLSEDR
ncbi:hypothetical protein Ddye_021235 [Dipteronia dyeriana]|uniref:Uncharacterized protein n=1 Tax=Dipteronia dyeriana TaxID=168575 RepID=A0AAD9U178_9ROSI|nr:hypothetical protein Ddye_021235 [Dipteronia dyeriana]